MQIGLRSSSAVADTSLHHLQKQIANKGCLVASANSSSTMLTQRTLNVRSCTSTAIAVPPVSRPLGVQIVHIKPVCLHQLTAAPCPNLTSRRIQVVALSTSEAATSSTTEPKVSSTHQPADNNSSQPNASASGPVNTAESPSLRKEAQLTAQQYKEIYDRLISIFQQRPRDDWKKLIVFSKQWPQHQQGVFDRIKELSDGEQDIDKKMGLRKLLRSLQGVNEEVNRYHLVLKKFSEAAQDEWEAIVTVYRGDLQKPFFEHMQCLIAAAKDDKDAMDKLVMMNTKLVALCANYDSIEADQEKMAAAAAVYRDLLNSISSLEEAEKKMEELASQGRIDPAFLQISAKAYGAARDTNMTLDEAKWVAYKLYRHARDYFDRQQPTEKRIIEYLLTISDPQERRNQLDAAVTPGPTRYTDTHDYMWTTPQRLYIVLDKTLEAYMLMRDGATANLNTSEASVLPSKIRVMKELRDEIVRRYL